MLQRFPVGTFLILILDPRLSKLVTLGVSILIRYFPFLAIEEIRGKNTEYSSEMILEKRVLIFKFRAMGTGKSLSHYQEIGCAVNFGLILVHFPHFHV